MSDDDIFGALGGSLMKDLLADLEVDDGDNLFSLDQLEKELASMDRAPPMAEQQAQSLPQFPPGIGAGGGLGLPPFNAASLLNTVQAQQSASGTAVDGQAPSGPDAWSLSLQNFTSLSLQEDFLAADSARKQSQQQQVVTAQPTLKLEGAEEYDVKEKLSIAPPPGMGGSAAGSSTTSSAPEPTPLVAPPVPPQQQFPKTPQNSISIPQGGGNQSDSAAAMRDAILSAVQAEASKPTTEQPKPQPASPKQAPSSVPPQQMQPPAPAVPTGSVPQPPPPPQGVMMGPPQPHPGQPPLPGPNGYYPHGPPQFPPGGPVMVPPGPGPHPPVMATMVPPGAVPMMGMPMPPIPMGRPMPPPPPPPQMMMPPMPPTGTGVVMGAAVPTSGPAWQTPNRMPPPPMVPQPPRHMPRRVYCNPLPSAPPIPATALETSYMSGRDIAFVVHGILKPVLSAGVSEDDYYLQYIRRRGGPQANPVNPKKALDLDKEMSSRESKAKEWASEKATLGYVSKSNVSRPRALIATPKPVADQEETEEKKRRATLWKSRVYSDQAYQAFDRVVEIWRMAAPGSVPPQVQAPLAKLMKCMGISRDENQEYTVDTEPLKLLTKLGKGRGLVSRVLEQALLPPKAVQALLPNLLDVTMTLPTDPTTERLYGAVGSILIKLPDMTSETLIRTLEVLGQHGKVSISSPAKMACAHSLLSRGSQVIPQDPSEESKASWSAAEKTFTSIL